MTSSTRTLPAAESYATFWESNKATQPSDGDRLAPPHVSGAAKDAYLEFVTVTEEPSVPVGRERI